ncbi:TIGR03826 family flagellar region protein [Thalassobacillus sp. CUG 92003]|uniref:TIGR03826 family flagellar region protein n=1 Tax=Thalassobacillus sp. CUG 92003 TaxID=2736641 RepID=UPI0015E6A620|nr:TIGR03826 family flagellar region protein [Thalassobacillus sp. CUG 92003]
MGELANCPRCGEIFVKGRIDVCVACYKEEERAFETVYVFIRKRQNRTATMQQVVEATGVEEQLIQKFVKQKRLNTTQFPQLSYSCERCGAQIQEGRICDGCNGNLQHDLKIEEDIEQVSEKNRLAEQAQTYYSVNKGNP